VLPGQDGQPEPARQPVRELGRLEPVDWQLLVEPGVVGVLAAPRGQFRLVLGQK
jgi:hypothetical protein